VPRYERLREVEGLKQLMADRDTRGHPCAIACCRAVTANFAITEFSRRKLTVVLSSPLSGALSSD